MRPIIKCFLWRIPALRGTHPLAVHSRSVSGFALRAGCTSSIINTLLLASS